MKTQQKHKCGYCLCGSCLFYDALSNDCSCMQGFPTNPFDKACEKYLPYDRHTDRTYHQDEMFARKMLAKMSRH